MNMFSGGGGGLGFSPWQQGMLGSGLGQFFGGMFGDSGQPYQDAMNQYQKWAEKGAGYQQPFYQAGTGAIGDYQKWLQGQQDPSGFINKLMGQYQQSPWAKYQTDQAMSAAKNMGSATGLTGSTPLTQFAQQSATDISSQDMSKWLQNVLGINQQYGAGQAGLMGMGQGAGNALTNMYNQMAGQMASGAYGQRAGENQDRMNMWGGIGNLVGMFL